MGKVVSLGSAHQGSSSTHGRTRAPVRKFFNPRLLVEKIRTELSHISVYKMKKTAQQNEYVAEQLMKKGDAESISRAVKLLDEAIKIREKMLFLMGKLSSPFIGIAEEDLHDATVLRDNLHKKLAGLSR